MKTDVNKVIKWARKCAKKTAEGCKDRENYFTFIRMLEGEALYPSLTNNVIWTNELANLRKNIINHANRVSILNGKKGVFSNSNIDFWCLEHASSFFSEMGIVTLSDGPINVAKHLVNLQRLPTRFIDVAEKYCIEEFEYTA